MGRLSKEALKKRKAAIIHKESYDFNKDHGICPICRREDSAIGHVYCQTCLDKEKRKKWERDPGFEKRKADKKARYKTRVEQHICVDCRKKLAPNYKFKRCPRCLENHRFSHQLWKIKKRLETEKKGVMAVK